MNSRIKEIRKSLHLTQEEFGSKIGLTRSVISEMELGTSPIQDRTIILISSVYNVNDEWLRLGIGNMFNISNKKFNEFFEIFNNLSEPLQDFLFSTALELLKTQSKL